MRKLLSKTAGATFNEERPNLTLCVRKDCIEFMYMGNHSAYNYLDKKEPASGDEALIKDRWMSVM